MNLKKDKAKESLSAGDGGSNEWNAFTMLHENQIAKDRCTATNSKIRKGKGDLTF